MNKNDRNQKLYTFFKILSFKYFNFDLVGYAAQVGFFLLLSLIPLLLVFLSLIPFFNISSDTFKQYLQMIITNEVYLSIISNFVETLSISTNNFVLSISIIFVIYASSAAVSTILKVVDIMYNETTTRNFVVRKFKAFYLTFFFIILLLLMISTYTLSSSIIVKILNINSGIVTGLSFLSNLLFPLFFSILLLIVYMIGSNKHYKIYTYIPGTIISICLIYLSSFLFNIYIDSFSKYTLYYGALGLLIGALLWLLIVCTLVLVGALINSVYANYLIENNKNIVKEVK